MNLRRICLIVGAGIFVGAANGLFGGGGGMICVPLLLLLGLDNKRAQATAILIMLPISLVSAIIYIIGGQVELSPTLFVSIGSIVGGLLGALLLNKLNNKALQFIFAFVVLGVGIRMIF